MIQRRQLIGTAGGLALLSAVGQAAAQPKPGNIKIICGYAPGGTTDQLCRQVAAKLSPGYVPSVIVENKTGAQAVISVAYVKQQPADGSHILQATFTMFSLFPQVYKNLQYEAADFVPLTAGCQVEYAFAVGPMVPPSIRTVQEYVAWTKRDPRNATFAAIGQLPTIVGLLLGKASNVELVQVQYKGGAPAVQDTMAGNIPGVVTTIGDIVPFLGDKLRLLATTGDKRNTLTPNVPTFVEQGVADVVVKNYFAFFAHAKTPAELVASHSAAIRAALAQKDVVDALARVALDPLPTDPNQTAELLAKDRVQWAAYIKRVNYQPPAA
ncbi:tripartite tricarboxylate transporter substrate-binding protein [Ramlibacter sp. WS9]|uniref:tripartite tricarboxylate transporter substrate-binding protein n=1 Tax=Ramlibacter sp. WS9 TaxID=1882741 RepID=UPI0013053C55|nr:tripartite tricarboxylate transporter substrate-binding protein [Ramlibacter sp. WS9]